MTRQVVGYVVSEKQGDQYKVIATFSGRGAEQVAKSWVTKTCHLTKLYSQEFCKAINPGYILPKRYWPV